MSCPSNKTLPDVDNRSPVRQLKNVDLPAPFGPISPRMSPCSSVTEASSTALKLPNALVIPRASRSMACSRVSLGLAARRDQAKQAARLEARDHDDDRAVKHEGEPGALAPE